MKNLILVVLIILGTNYSWSQSPVNNNSNNGLVPTYANVSYGAGKRQVFDIWLASSKKDKTTPLVMHIHGGGFRGGDKNSINLNTVKHFLDAGISVASINYRLSDEGPYPIMMNDAARCLQTIRSKSKEWNLNPEKIACYGGSAGAGISLWLGFHDDMADPSSPDPISRQSTRITAVGAMSGQSTYDMRTFCKWFGVKSLKSHNGQNPFFGMKSDSEINSKRVRELMEDASPINHLTKDDVPVFMKYGSENIPVDENTSPSIWVHHPLLGIKLQEAMFKMGLECELQFPGQPATKYKNLEAFLMDKLF